MPPKRKRAETSTTNEETTTTRSTRSSTRLNGANSTEPPELSKPAAPAKNGARKNSSGTGKGKESTPENATADETKQVDAQDSKRRKKSVAQENTVTTNKPKTTKAAPRATRGRSKQNDDEDELSRNKAATESVTSSINAPKAVATTDSIARAQAPELASTAEGVFHKYADEDDPNVMSPEGLERLCQSAKIPMEGALPLLLAWITNSKEMGKFSKEGWLHGLNNYGITNEAGLVVALNDLNNVVVLRTPIRKPVDTGTNKGSRIRSTTQPDSYKKDKLWQLSMDTQAAFSKLYAFCFALAKPESSRNIDMVTATALWTVLLGPTYPIISEIVAFIEERGTYKGVNKDLWNMMHEFCRVVKPSLEDYENDGAWPTLLDDFVEWKKQSSNTSE